ncbi:TspO/MBR family protein [Prosthecomicrobium sp. N25]|uniref:TspO/MBR family protein n=1 Tax=Prosthecomicrobium sp. N25 TaxID=3129254 RepID=UPI00307756AE
MDTSTFLTTAVVAAAGILLVAAGATLTEIGPWYRSLKKPSWQPPEYLFGPVWTAIFLMMGISAVMAWTAAPAGYGVVIFGSFAVNAVLNVAWSAIFFRLRRPDWAFFELVLLWLSIIGLAAAVWPVSPMAAALLGPYLAWVSFAGVLNLKIVRLNAPFSAA